MSSSASASSCCRTALTVTPRAVASASARASPARLSLRSSSWRVVGSALSAPGTGASITERSRKDQVQVAELVPQVSPVEGSLVGVLQEPAAGDGFEDQQVGGVRLVPAGEQAVHHPDAPLG